MLKDDTGGLQVTRTLVASPSSPLLVRSTTRSPDGEGSRATGPASWPLWGDTKPPRPGRGVPRPSAQQQIPAANRLPRPLLRPHRRGLSLSLGPAVPAPPGSASAPGAGLRWSVRCPRPPPHGCHTPGGGSPGPPHHTYPVLEAARGLPLWEGRKPAPGRGLQAELFLGPAWRGGAGGVTTCEG